MPPQVRSEAAAEPSIIAEMLRGDDQLAPCPHNRPAFQALH